VIRRCLWLISIGYLTLTVTWGFSVYAYGRWQRLSGFVHWAECNDVVEHMRANRTEWIVQDCDLDFKRSRQ
jgi:hypothetical protein